MCSGRGAFAGRDILHPASDGIKARFEGLSQMATGFCQLQRTALAVNQRHAKVGFKAADLLADRRVADVQFRPCTRHVSNRRKDRKRPKR